MAPDHAVIIARFNIDPAWNDHSVIAGWGYLFHAHRASNLRDILMLPARKIFHGMTTLENPIFLEYICQALVRTRSPALSRTWVCATIKRPRTRFKANDSVVEKFCMTFFDTSVATL